MNSLEKIEPKNPGHISEGWLAGELSRIKNVLPSILKKPKFYLAMLGFSSAVSTGQAQSELHKLHQHQQSFVEIPVNKHFSDGKLSGQDAVAFLFAPVAYEMNLGDTDRMQKFLVDFVYGGKDFNVAQVEDSTQVSLMKDRLEESLREVLKKDFLSLYGPFLRGHLADGFLEDWEKSEMGAEFLGNISAIKIKGYSSPEAEKYGSGALAEGDVQSENTDLAKKRAEFVKSAFSSLFQEMGVSDVDIDFELIGEEQQFSSEEMSELADMARNLGFKAGSELELVHQLLMFYNDEESKKGLPSKYLERLRDIVDSKRVVEVEVTLDGGASKKILIPIPVLLLLLGLGLRRLFRNKKEVTLYREDFYPYSTEVPAAGSDEDDNKPDTRIFSESVINPNSLGKEIDPIKIDQNAMKRVFAERELGERLQNPEAKERGLDYQSELEETAVKYQRLALEPEFEMVDSKLSEELGKIVPDIQEWSYAVKNLKNDERLAASLAISEVPKVKLDEFERRGKELKKEKDKLYKNFKKLCLGLERTLATKIVASRSNNNAVDFDGSIGNKLFGVRIARSLAGEDDALAEGVWNQIIANPEFGNIAEVLKNKVSAAVWSYAIPLSTEETIFEERLVRPEVRRELEQKIKDRILEVWQKHDRSFETATEKRAESMLGGGEPSSRKNREDFMRLQRLRYPTSEVVDDKADTRLHEVTYQESPEIKLWGEFWAKKVAAPIVESAIFDWVKELRSEYLGSDNYLLPNKPLQRFLDRKTQDFVDTKN